MRCSIKFFMKPLPLPRFALATAAWLWPALRGPVSRIDQDLLADNGTIEGSLGVHPRTFDPDADAWRGESAR